MRRFLSIWINLFIALTVFTLWFRLLFTYNSGGRPVRFNPEGLQYLKYFTVLSNLLMGVAALAHAVALSLAACGVLRRVPKAIRRLKYISTCAVGLTFFTVLCFLGPRTGFRDSYDGANLWFHLLIPLAAMLEFTLIDREGRIPPRYATLALAMPALYGAAYLGNLIANGYGGRDHSNDWYDFAADGPAGAFIALPAMLLAAWVIGRALGKPREKGKASRRERQVESLSGK